MGGFLSRFRKTLRRASHGRFHLNPLKNGAHALSDPIGHAIYQALPSHQKRRIYRLIDFGRNKKKLLSKLGLGNNSASVVYTGSSGYMPGGYVYQGRSIGELM